jgi:probable HAF family extracellular repeat protein
MNTKILERSILLTLFAISFQTSAAVHYRVINLEAAGGPATASSTAVAINNRGDVAGNFWTPGFTENRVFRYTDATGMIDLRYPGRGPVRAGFVVGLNDQGQMAVEGPAHPKGPSQIYRYTDGVGYVNLGTLGGRESQASGSHCINNRGQVTGISDRRDGLSRAFRYTDGIGMEDLGALGGGHSSGWGINDLGWVVGASAEHAILFRDDGGMIDLGPGVAYGINNVGTVVGTADMLDGTSQAFVYLEGQVRLIGRLGGNQAGALAVNDANVVVGYSISLLSRTGAFVWTAEDGMLDLNTLIPEKSGWYLAVAASINTAGQIAGFGHFQGKPVAWRLEPIND